jgi:hypothetical protein
MFYIIFYLVQSVSSFHLEVDQRYPLGGPTSWKMTEQAEDYVIRQLVRGVRPLTYLKLKTDWIRQKIMFYLVQSVATLR